MKGETADRENREDGKDSEDGEDSEDRDDGKADRKFFLLSHRPIWFLKN